MREGNSEKWRANSINYCFSTVSLKCHLKMTESLAVTTKDMLEHIAVHFLMYYVQSGDKNYSALPFWLLLPSRSHPPCSLNSTKPLLCSLRAALIKFLMIIHGKEMPPNSRLWRDTSYHSESWQRHWEWHLYPACISDLGSGRFSLYKMSTVSFNTQSSQQQ